MNMKRKIEIKLIIFFKKNYDVFLQISDKNENEIMSITKKNYFINDFFNNNKIDEMFIEINNFFTNDRKEKYLIDFFVINNCNFKVNVKLDKNYEKNVSWIKKIINEEMFMDEKEVNYYLLDDNLFVVNEKIIKIFNIIKEKIERCKKIDVKNINYIHNKHEALNVLIRDSYTINNYYLVIINKIENYYLSYVYEKINDDYFIHANYYLNFDALIKDLNVIIDDKFDSVIYFDDTFYEQLLDKFKLNIGLQKCLYLNDKIKKEEEKYEVN